MPDPRDLKRLADFDSPPIRGSTKGPLLTDHPRRGIALRGLRMGNPDRRPKILEEMVRTDLARQFSLLRERENLSVRALAARAGISRQVILSLEAGSLPSLGSLIRLADALGVALSVNLTTHQDFLSTIDQGGTRALKLPKFDPS